MGCSSFSATETSEIPVNDYDVSAKLNHSALKIDCYPSERNTMSWVDLEISFIYYETSQLIEVCVSFVLQAFCTLGKNPQKACAQRPGGTQHQFECSENEKKPADELQMKVTNIYTIPLYVPPKILNGAADYETKNFLTT
jgi:hypothetical protein